jgi:hypothetical protein
METGIIATIPDEIGTPQKNYAKIGAVGENGQQNG